jgi:hypothetical protein
MLQQILPHIVCTRKEDRKVEEEEMPRWGKVSALAAVPLLFITRSSLGSARKGANKSLLLYCTTPPGRHQWHRIRECSEVTGVAHSSTVNTARRFTAPIYLPTSFHKTMQFLKLNCARFDQTLK